MATLEVEKRILQEEVLVLKDKDTALVRLLATDPPPTLQSLRQEQKRLALRLTAARHTQLDTEYTKNESKSSFLLSDEVRAMKFFVIFFSNYYYFDPKNKIF